MDFIPFHFFYFETIPFVPETPVFDSVLPAKDTNSLIQVMDIICSFTFWDWEWVMRMLTILGKSTSSGFSIIWPRNSPSRFSQRVDISGLVSSRILKSGSRNSGRCLTIWEYGTLSSRLIQETKNWRTNFVLAYILSRRIGMKAGTSNLSLSVTISLSNLSKSSEPFLTFWLA